jgi:tetratricopeptide (TPR) repeat protein
LDPNYATGHHWYAEHLAFRGHFDESFQEIERARQLDPLSLTIQTDNAVFLYFARRYDRAIAQFGAVSAVEPEFSRVHMVALAYAQAGYIDKALADVEAFPHEERQDWVWIWCYQAYIYGHAGRRVQARRNLEELLRYNRRHSLDPMILVTPYIGIGDKAQALAWLEKSVSAHSPGLVALKVDPVYDPLRSDPRFQILLHTVGLTQ